MLLSEPQPHVSDFGSFFGVDLSLHSTANVSTPPGAPHDDRLHDSLMAPSSKRQRMASGASVSKMVGAESYGHDGGHEGGHY